MGKKIPSYQKINYALRASKNIERKMLIQFFRRLASFKPVHEYQYIGFGSLYFSDFILFHKILGLTKMISIEGDQSAKERFEFNKPYRYVNLIFGYSNDVLPEIHIDDQSIIWLDYDGKLSKSVLGDITILLNRIQSGTMILLTINVHPDSDSETTGLTAEQKLNQRVENFSKSVGKENIPITTTSKSYSPKEFPELCKRVIESKIEQVLMHRNGTLDYNKKLNHSQVIYFNYNDGVLMSTIGYIFYSNEDSHKFDKCNFKDLPFFKSGDDPYKISFANLTQREIKYIDSLIPIDHSTIDSKGIPITDIQTYEETYLYYPYYLEVSS